MKTTRRESMKMVAAFAASCALPAMPRHDDGLSHEQIVRLAERLFNTVVFWGYPTWKSPQSLPIEIRLPRDISNAVGGQIPELLSELRRYCPEATIASAEDDRMFITYFFNGRSYVAGFNDVYYGDFLPRLEHQSKPQINVLFVNVKQ